MKQKMNEPKYVLRTYESAWAPTKNAKQVAFAKKAVRIILVVLLVGSLLFQDNLFVEMSFMPKVLLISLFFGTCFVKTKEKVPKPFEIRFYEDHLVLYRENRYYSPRLSRMEFDKFMYKDIKKILYRPETHRLNIYGVVEGKWFNYNKDGSLPENPSYHKTTDSFSYFYTNEAPDVDFVEVFEKYTPIKVTILEN